MERPYSATRGMTVLISRKIASNDRASNMEPKPDSPCIKAAKKTTKHIHRYVPIAFPQRVAVYAVYSIFPFPRPAFSYPVSVSSGILEDFSIEYGFMVPNPIFFIQQAGAQMRTGN